MKNQRKELNETRMRRRRRVRAKISGTAKRPRLSVFRSSRHMHAQLIDDGTGKTLVMACDAEVAKKASGKKKPGGGTGANIAVAHEVGKLLGEKAKKAGINSAVFDKGRYAYAGRVRSLADGARESGLKF